MKFNELEFFAQLKKRPAIYLGTQSLLHLRTFIFGMYYAFDFHSEDDNFFYFHSFIQ